VEGTRRGVCVAGLISFIRIRKVRVLRDVIAATSEEVGGGILDSVKPRINKTQKYVSF